jgi:hypothetical protein
MSQKKLFYSVVVSRARNLEPQNISKSSKGMNSYVKVSFGSNQKESESDLIKDSKNPTYGFSKIYERELTIDEHIQFVLNENLTVTVYEIPAKASVLIGTVKVDLSKLLYDGKVTSEWYPIGANGVYGEVEIEVSISDRIMPPDDLKWSRVVTFNTLSMRKLPEKWRIKDPTLNIFTFEASLRLPFGDENE